MHEEADEGRKKRRKGVEDSNREGKKRERETRLSRRVEMKKEE